MLHRDPSTIQRSRRRKESSQPRLPSQSGCAAEKARWECQLPVGIKEDSVPLQSKTMLNSKP